MGSLGRRLFSRPVTIPHASLCPGIRRRGKGGRASPIPTGRDPGGPRPLSAQTRAVGSPLLAGLPEGVLTAETAAAFWDPYGSARRGARTHLAGPGASLRPFLRPALPTLPQGQVCACATGAAASPSAPSPPRAGFPRHHRPGVAQAGAAGGEASAPRRTAIRPPSAPGRPLGIAVLGQVAPDLAGLASLFGCTSRGCSRRWKGQGNSSPYVASLQHLLFCVWLSSYIFPDLIRRSQPRKKLPPRSV